MKYTNEITNKLVEDYKRGLTVEELATTLQVPSRSIIAKLSSLGVYQRKVYTNKRGELPQKKSEIIERLATLLQVDSERLESLEKVNKTVLLLIETKLDPKPHHAE